MNVADEIQIKEEPRSPLSENRTVDVKPTVVPEPIQGGTSTEGGSKKSKCCKNFLF